MEDNELFGEPIEVRVPAFNIPYTEHYLSESIRLNSMQASVKRLVSKCGENRILLTAPTGSGKTLTLLMSEWCHEGYSGFIALYPNNTLLVNQMKTIREIIVNHFGGKEIIKTNLCGEESNCIEPLHIYQLPKNEMGNAWLGAEYIALLMLSGRYLTSPPGTPKREILYDIAEKIFSKKRKGIYTIVFATPDTFLLVATGAYRSFENVGKTLHNLLLAASQGLRDKKIAEKIIKTKVMIRPQVSPTLSVLVRLFDLPLFIDEFHLYGPFEVPALRTVLWIRDNRILWQPKPVVFSSATPAEDIIEALDIKTLDTVRAEISSGNGFPVRGETIFKIIPVHTEKKGFISFYESSYSLPNYFRKTLINILRNRQKGRALIIFERLWMVVDAVYFLAERGITPECIMSIRLGDVCKPGSSIIVASEAATQGVNLGKVTFGAFGGVSGEDVVQRIGRIGRKGIDSEVHLLVPSYSLENNQPVSNVQDYYEFVNWILQVYPDYSKRKRDISKLIPKPFFAHREKLMKQHSLASIARNTGDARVLGEITIDPEEALRLLDSVIGPPSILARIIVFRRSGFSVDYVDPSLNIEGSSSVGILARNFRIEGTIDSVRGVKLVVSVRDRSRARIRIMADNNPGVLIGERRGIFISLKLLLNLLNGKILVSGAVLDSDKVDDTLVYVFQPGEDLADYISYTGEGAIVESGGQREYAVIFL